MEIEIPTPILDYAKLTANLYTPSKRYSGFQDDNGTRGFGDLLDLIGTLTIFQSISQNNKICELNLTSGKGDKSDLRVPIKQKMRKVNLKTSAFIPYRNGLNLYIKKEEIKKSIDIYIQCFVHLDENDLPPHIHIAGCCAKNSQLWNNYAQELITIPNTKGHQGMGIPIEKLISFNTFLTKIEQRL